MSAHAARIERAFVDETLIREAFEPVDRLAAELQDAPHPEDSGAELVRLARRLGEAGVLRLVVPARDGGVFPELSSRALCLARERLGHALPLAELAFAMQGLGSYPIVHAGSEALRKQWLPDVVAGRAIAAFALTEPDAGSDLGGLSTHARRDGDHYVLDGHKVFISNAGVASFYSLFAVTDAHAPKKKLSAFVVPADADGLRVVPQHVLGGHPIGELRLHGVRVPVASRLGEEGEGMGIALATLARFRPTVGAAALGFAQRALDEAVHHVRTRKQFGAALAEQPQVQAMLADSACELDAARLLVYRAAACADAGGTRAELARAGSMAKLVATENAQRVIDRAVQLHGGRGVLQSSVVARLYEEVRALRIYEGATEVQKILVARALLGAAP